jgi:DNA-binding SARP family transcriptional activator
VEFRVLGPLEVVEDDRPVALPGAKQRALVALLCLRANEAVPTGSLIDALWEDEPPEKAQTALQYHVSQVRKLLGPGRIETRPGGYALRLGGEELDLARFERLVALARLPEALALWRGPALAEFRDREFARGEVARLEELRLAALEGRIEDDLAGGRHAEVVAELEALVRDHPLRERTRAQLMLALYRSGRQAEALGLYRETRRLLVEELGIEPGEELQRLERRILNQDPALAPPAAVRAPVPGPRPLAAPREERKVVTVLSCDLAGDRVAGLDPEDVAARLARSYERVRAVLERHGASVGRPAGAAVVAVFGAPVAHEDDPERAVRAALELRAQGSVRVGVDTGEALVRLDHDPADWPAAGEVVGAASRLREEADAGSVVVADATYRATREAIAYEVDAAGRRRALAVAAGATAPSAPFVGREDDLALLQQAYARAVRERSVVLVTVAGEPGIGKTRLLAELRRVVEAGGVLWRQGRCLPYGEGITFWALGEIVKAQAGVLGSDTAGQAAAKLAAATAAVAPESEREWLAARLAPLVGAAAPSAAVTERSEAFAAWRTFLELVASQRPLVLALEDLHWADPALLEFVEHLVDWPADVPMLVLCTTRPELYDREPSWAGGKRNAATLSLSPLSEEDTARLVGALLAAVALPSETQAALLERAGGNPLYAREFARMLVDRGVVRRRGRSFELGAGADIPVPESVQAVIAARLDTLPPDRKALLRDAAVVGHVFWAGALATLGGVPKEAVLDGLRELGRRELVRRSRSSSFADDAEYSFSHVLVRDAAYAQIPRSPRARKHAAAAAWIERSAERTCDVAELLAHHYETALELARAAGDPEHAQTLDEPAVRFLVLAAERALGLDHVQADRYYRRALAFLREDDPRRPSILAESAEAGIGAAGASSRWRPSSTTRSRGCWRRATPWRLPRRCGSSASRCGAARAVCRWPTRRAGCSRAGRPARSSPSSTSASRASTRSPAATARRSNGRSGRCRSWSGSASPTRR